MSDRSCGVRLRWRLAGTERVPTDSKPLSVISPNPHTQWLDSPSEGNPSGHKPSYARLPQGGKRRQLFHQRLGARLARGETLGAGRGDAGPFRLPQPGNAKAARADRTTKPARSRYRYPEPGTQSGRDRKRIPAAPIHPTRRPSRISKWHHCPGNHLGMPHHRLSRKGRRAYSALRHRAASHMFCPVSSRTSRLYFAFNRAGRLGRMERKLSRATLRAVSGFNASRRT